MKKIIGLVPAANNLFVTDLVYEDKYYFINNYIERINESGAIVSGVLGCNGYLYDVNDLDIYDGFIMAGGGKIHPYHLQVVEYVIKNNKPFLGICMGMQALAIYFLLEEEKKKRNYNGSITELFEILKEEKYMFTEPVQGHRNAELNRDNLEEIKHEVIIDKDSILYDIYKTDKLNMPSIHRYRLQNVVDKLKVKGIAEDGTIEVIEYNDKIFGVQFHPENESINNKLFKYIINKC